MHLILSNSLEFVPVKPQTFDCTYVKIVGYQMVNQCFFPRLQNLEKDLDAHQSHWEIRAENTLFIYNDLFLQLQQDTDPLKA